MKNRTSLPLVLAILTTMLLTGCLGLRPATDPIRFYVLSEAPIETVVTNATGNLAFGLGRVDVPAYLLDNRIAVRKGHSEIEYADYDQWAERLDEGIRRVLAANIASLLNSPVLSSWQRGHAAAEIYVSIQRFECDTRGNVTLDARWQISSVGGEETWHTDRMQITTPGPPLQTNPEGAITALSHALADLSQKIAATTQEVTDDASISKSEKSR